MAESKTATAAKEVKSAPAAKTATRAAAPKAAAAKPAAKTTPAKSNASSTTAKKPAAKRATASTASKATSEVSLEQRYKMICDAAYYRAEKRGFAPENEIEDWLAAEAEIDALLGRK